MRKELTDQAEAMARLRAQELGEELRNAGLLPADGEDEPASVAPVRRPGRHARPAEGMFRAAGSLERLRERVAERVPFAAPHLTVLVALAAVVLVVVAWVRISASSEAVPVPRARTAQPFPTSSGSPPSPASGPSSSSAVSPGASTTVVVDVAGKVNHPGVLTLPAGSRVVDAIRRAGGASGGADLSTLNLARVLVDGEQILVGVPAPVPAPGVSPGGTSGAGADAVGGPVSLNQATLEQLESLPGVGPVTAQKILDYRTSHGAFGSLDELLDVDGIGEKTLAQLSPHLTL